MNGVTITLAFDNIEQAAEFALAYGGALRAEKPAAPAPKPTSAAKTVKSADTSQPATPAAPTPAAAASGTKATALGQKPAATSPPAQPPAPPASTSLRDKPYPQTGIGELINGYIKKTNSKEGLGTAKAVLLALGGATKGSEIQPEHFDVAFAAFTALQAGTEPEVVLAGLATDEDESGGLGG